MRILFIARHFTYFRNYDSVLRQLASRGHQIHLAIEQKEVLGGRQAVEKLARECPTISFGELPPRPHDQRLEVAQRLRRGLDYLRYLERFYDGMPLLRVRARNRTPLGLVRLAEIRAGRLWRRGLVHALHRIESTIAPPQVVVDYVRDQKPDVVLITPLVGLGSQQIDFVRAARQLGIPTALAVWSWDHLSSKAFIRDCPERVFVWNETQRNEAVTLHRVASERVVVTGAQCFDHWFDRRPSRTREAFCAQLGLPADRPIVLYVCSSLIYGSAAEAPFVREWLTRLRAHPDPRVASAAVLVRPHPSKMAQWEGFDLSDLGPVARWGGNPINEDARADYFDSLYHSSAVVGINTSAFIEAGIVGREVLAILPEQFHDNHLGTAHFRYLLEIGGGLLRVSSDVSEHLAQLSMALVRPPTSIHPHRAFLESFVRPRGIDSAATPLFVEEVERLRDVPVAATAPQSTAWPSRVAEALAARVNERRYETWALSARELESVRRIRAEKAAHLEAALQHREMGTPDSPKAKRLAAKARQLAEKRARVDAEREARRSQAVTSR